VDEVILFIGHVLHVAQYLRECSTGQVPDRAQDAMGPGERQRAALLCPMSYCRENGNALLGMGMAGTTGLEPAASTVTGQRCDVTD